LGREEAEKIRRAEGEKLGSGEVGEVEKLRKPTFLPLPFFNSINPINLINSINESTK
jgi:hypothetical protein